MEDGIERMMTPESYNIHFLNENKIKKFVEKDLNVEKDLKVEKDLNVEKVSKKIFTFEKDNTIKDIKESTNPQ